MFPVVLKLGFPESLRFSQEVKHVGNWLCMLSYQVRATIYYVEFKTENGENINGGNLELPSYQFQKQTNKKKPVKRYGKLTLLDQLQSRFVLYTLELSKVPTECASNCHQTP